MLQLLHIENIAIIECADIAFQPGFNALTGETGAGKSIVIDSISAVLGQRTSRDLIRTGADMAFVSACFADVPPRLGGGPGHFLGGGSCCCSERFTAMAKTSAGSTAAPSR
ncbi:MAG: AAA family ATPase [Oscillospiraceae bacterium]